MQKQLLLPAVLSIFLAGCSVTEMEPGNGNDVHRAPQSKIINTPDYADSRSLLLFLGEDADASGSAIGSILKESGAVSCTKVFPDQPEGKERTSKLDRWYIVRFGEDVNLKKTAEAFAGLENVHKVEFNSTSRLASDRISHQYVPDITKAAGSGIFSDPMLPEQWSYSNNGDKIFAPTAQAGADVNAADAWRISGGNNEIIVAVIDEAVQYSHPDLHDNMWVNEDEIPGNGRDDDNNGYIDDIYGYNFAGRSGKLIWNLKGDSGHGTHVAGTVAAVNNNGEGVCGVAGGTGNGDGVRIMSCQIFSGGATTSDTEAAAIRYAADNGAHIIQCSWGVAAGAFNSDSEYEHYAGIVADAIDYFTSKPNDVLDGGIAIFAAGNESKDVSGYPAAHSKCISVTAFASDYLPAFYTNYGPGCNVAAPGGEYYTGGPDNDRTLILSTMPTESFPLYQQNQYGQLVPTGEMTAKDYGYMQGTSMACPHVSGVAALGLSHAKEIGKTFTREEFTSMLLTSVNEIDSRFTGYKESILPGNPYWVPGSWNVGPYKYKMGSGSVDAWQLMMQVEGTPSLFVTAGEENSVGIEKYMGNNAMSLTYLGGEIGQEGKESLGLMQDPEIRYGKLRIHPTRVGAAKITVRAIAGGTDLGTGNNMGGMEISKEISIVSRSVSNKNGGWL